jgi:hypothetical protein
MKFFLPLIVNNPALAEDTYQRIRRALEKTHGSLADRRYRKIEYTHNGKPDRAVVGEIDRSTGETVISIFYDPKTCCYLICTPGRGVRTDLPMYTSEVSYAEEFE